MADPKPFASLSPTLLARKGGARPAMRSQLQPLHHHYRDGAARPVEDDLGWNDMGHDSPDAPDAKPADAEAPVPAAVVALKPSLAVAEPAVSPVPVPVSRSSALKAGRRAAFTLRLDAERHLQLRLACTITNRSAQQIVTEALDQFLASQPDLAGLAAQVGKHR